MTLLALLAGGCATTQRVALAPTNRAGISQTLTAVSLEQPEIGADINESNISAATGGGLIFALIDAGINTSRAKKAEKAAADIRGALMDFDPNAALLEAVANQKARMGLPLTNTEIWPTAIDRKTIEARLKKATTDTVLLVSVDQRLTPDFSKIQVSARIALFPVKTGLAAPAEEKNGWPPAIYSNSFLTDRALPNFPPKATREEASQLWIANNAVAARTALKDCFDELARMIAYDLPLGVEANRAADKGEKVNAPMMQNGHPAAHGLVMVKAVVAQKTDDHRNWVRLPLGELVSQPF